ncbi:hypothetical protein LCGC14_0389950 [marine sediment metagenome]|uniref:Uncharacterized protein n=1 Tax=marine sediment metagenome TaxID=412755 RepID=A0A0F9W8T7_9ZZZZ
MKYVKIRDIADQLRKVSDIVDYDGNLDEHPVLVAASEINSDIVLRTAATALITAQTAIKNAVDSLELLADKAASELDEEDIDLMAALASEFDADGDPILKKQASVLDQVLLNFAQKGELVKAIKQAEAEVDRLREKYRQEAMERDYKEPSETHEKDIKAGDSAKEIANQVKKYRPMEAALSTRYCPDHPGAQFARIADGLYQCELDKKIYNFKEGYTTMKGNKVPGGDVSEQTRSLGDRALEQMHFSNRESRLQDNK